MKILLFVYGTLKRGLSNHHFLNGQRFVAEAVTLPRYRLHHLGWYPGMIEVEEGLEVRGEIYEVDAEALAKMDEFEGVPDQFVRKPVLIQHVFEPMEAYFYNRPVEAGSSFSDRWPFAD